MALMFVRDIFGVALICTGILDAIKYSIQAAKVREEKTSGALSRRFVNYAILNDIVKLAYALIIWDAFIILTSILALVCMLYLFWTMYIYYPYTTYPRTNSDYTGLIYRPSILTYLINSIIPNKKRERL